jgi:hypothetical protein
MENGAPGKAWVRIITDNISTRTGDDAKEWLFRGPAGFDPAPKKVAVSGSELRIVFAEKPAPDARPVRGLVIASAGGQDAFFDLEATSPDAGDPSATRGRSKKGRPRR